MAEILKYPTNQSKGIIIFTHKEIQYFTKKPKLFHRWKKIPYIKPHEYLKLNKDHNYFISTINQLHKHYFIGMHFGWLPELIDHIEFVDFYMGKPSMRECLPKDIFFIPLDGSCFTPKVFYKDNEFKKYWDILCISRNSKFKNLDKFLQQIRKIYDLGYSYKVLLVVPTYKTENSSSHLIEIADIYYEMFTQAEREQFTLLRLGSDLDVLGLSQTQLSLFYKLSKVFTLFSQVEGGSRVISEALLCGLPLVVKDDLLGGGKDFLNEENSVQFCSFDMAHKSLIYAVENYERLNQNPGKILNFLNEEKSIHSFRNYLTELYLQNSQQFDGLLLNSDRLNLRLNAHLNEGVVWSNGRFETADILSISQFEKFISCLDL
jgi:glycosyltransferase involved in cell wall biosynthesis